MSRFSLQIALFMALLLSNAIILFANMDWIWLRLPAAVALTFVLPGWAWLPLFGWLKTNRAIEQAVSIFAVSLSLSSFVLLVVVLLPGPFSEAPVLIALNVTALMGLGMQLFIRKPQPLSLQWPPRRVMLILLVILAVAAFTRLTRLGYAEFHEDELENMRLIVRAFKGEEYVPFLDSKGPIHWLLPAALWYGNGWVNETVARAPFALASLMLIPAMYVVGRRMSDGRDSVGLIAAGIVALNGFFASLARHVENRSLIVFLGVFAVWLLYRYYKESRHEFLLYLALVLAIGLIAHPTVLLYLPVAAYVIGMKLWQDRQKTPWVWLAGGLGLFAALLMVFYVPYFANPAIAQTYEYFANERIGTSFLYNRLEIMLGEDRLYSSRFHGPVLILLLAWLLARNFFRAGRWGGAAFVILGLAVISTVVAPNAWIVGRLNLAFLPCLLITLLMLSFPRTTFETKVAFLWFSVPFGALIFLARDASNHIQVAYTGWALLCAFALVDLWQVLSRSDSTALPLVQGRTDKQTVGGIGESTPSQPPPFGKLRTQPARGRSQNFPPSGRESGGESVAQTNLSALEPPLEGTEGRPSAKRGITVSALKPLAKAAIVLSLAVIIPLIVFYQYLSFGARVTTYWQAKIDYTYNPDSLYNRVYGSIARPRRAISNPRLGGWKAVGYLWETGTLSGDFRSINESFAVPIWYTFQTPRSCYNDPQNYWLRRDWQGWPEQADELSQQGYTLTRIVLVDQEPKLRLYEKNAGPQAPEILDVEQYRHKFDRLATPLRFAQADAKSQPASLNFGDKLLLVGYDLPPSGRAGTLLPVTLYWEGLAPMDIRYRAFVHLVDGEGNRWGQHDDDPACRLITPDMQPGQQASRQFRVPVDPAVPPGEYQILVGVYRPDTFERLPIWNNEAGQSPGDSVVLGEVVIE